jgi:deoxyribose-phosphate aldolase
MDEIRQPAVEPVVKPIETYESLAELLELTLLAPSLSADDVDEGCRIAREYGVGAVVVRPCDVEMVKRWMDGSGVKVASVAGYPYGVSTTSAKLYEGRDLLRIGVQELDFVLNPAAMISRQFQHVETELMQVVRSAHESDATLTVVCNNRTIADDLKIIATRICKRVEADAIAVQHSEADLAIIKPLLKDLLRLKRSDAVMTLEEALATREAGYSRMTTPNVATILDGWKLLLAEKAKEQQVSQQVS